MYEKEASDAELAAFGLRRSDYDGSAFEVWPECWPAVQLFSSLATQWRVWFSGATGLDHNVMFHRMDRMGLSREEYDELEQDVQLLEREALGVMREKD